LPEIYPRPPDQFYDFDTVYASGPDDYSVGLPSGTNSVEVDDGQVQDVVDSIGAVSQALHCGEVLARQACYKPQIRKHEEDEEVGPMVGPTGVAGLWLATGHDEWGIQNSLGAGLVISEMLLEREAKSADVSLLDPKHFMNALAPWTL
jgi:glycine/D-amino acid oxidase-like deaminating enzyme